MLDQTDRKLLEALSKNARAPLSDLARQLGVPRTTLAQRLERLVESGVIKRFTVSLDRGKLGYRYLTFILVKVRRGGGYGERSSQEILAEEIAKYCNSRDDMPWIEEAHIITGDYDILLKAWSRDLEHLTRFLIRYMPSRPEVAETYTMLVLETPVTEAAARI